MTKLDLRKNCYPGKLIVFEGTDGSGKTTLVSLTKSLLEEWGETVVSITQPTDFSRQSTLFQKMMYSKNHSDVDYRAVQLLTMSDRVQQTYEVIDPALRAGKTVLCDRYIYTSLASMLARGYFYEPWFYDVARLLYQPNYIFFANVPPEFAVYRMKQEHNRYIDEELIGNVAGQFLDMSKRERFTMIDTTKEPDVAFHKVKKILIAERLRSKSVSKE